MWDPGWGSHGTRLPVSCHRPHADLGPTVRRPLGMRGEEATEQVIGQSVLHAIFQQTVSPTVWQLASQHSTASAVSMAQGSQTSHSFRNLEGVVSTSCGLHSISENQGRS